MKRVRLVSQRLILIGFLLILVFGPIFYGAVLDWQVGLLGAVSIIVFAAWAITNLFSSKTELLSKDSCATLYLVYGLPVLFTVVIVFQLISLPDSLLGVLSPTHHSLNKLAGIGGNTPASIVPHTTKLWLYRTIGCFIVFVVAAHAFTNRKHLLYILAVVVVLGYLNALYGILQYLSGYSLPSLFERKYCLDRVAGSYVNANHFAGYLEMCIALTLSVIFIRRGTSDTGLGLARRIVNFFSEKLQDKRFLLPLSAVVLMSLAIVFSMSRMGIFSFVVSMILFGLLIGKKHTRKVRLAIFGSVVAVILVVSFWLGLDPVLERYSLLSGGVTGRVEAWKMTGKVIRDYSFLGTGLGTFTHVSPNYQTPATACGHWAESHNDYLNLMSDTGVVGFAIAIAFMVAWYVYVLKLLSKRNLRTYQRSIAVGCVAGVSAIVIHSIADFNLQIPANAFYFATLLGLAIAVLRIRDIPSGSRNDDRNGNSSKADSISAVQKWRLGLAKLAPCVAAAILGIVVLPMIVRGWMAEMWLEEGKNSRKTKTQIQAFGQSISMESDNPEPHFLLGKVLYREKIDDEKAKTCFEEAVRLAPTIERYHYRLGMAYARLGDDQLAEKEFSLAKSLAPMYADIYYKIGFYHFFKGLRTRSRELLAKALSEFRQAAEISSMYLHKSLKLVVKYLPQYENLRALVPDTPGHHSGFASFLAGKGRWPEALEEYRIVWRLKLKKDPSYRGDDNLCLALARCYLMTGGIDDAKRGYIKALGITSNRPRVFSAIRCDFTRAKLQKEGLSLLLGIREKSPDDFALNMEIAKSLLALGDYHTAEKLFLELSELRPSGQIYNYLFGIAMRERNYDLAEVYAGFAIRLNPSEANHYAMLARAKEANNDYEGAIKALRQAISIRSEESYKEELKKIQERMLFEKK